MSTTIDGCSHPARRKRKCPLCESTEAATFERFKATLTEIATRYCDECDAGVCEHDIARAALVGGADAEAES